MLGLHPLYLVNEGLFMAVVKKEIAIHFLQQLQQDERGINAAIIGEVVSGHRGKVILKNRIGAGRWVTI